ncbi:hypothetical protein LHK_01048 [Laribacter hongkongensis HLHK9]|uniref:Uncharacterized protein n=1 Tax=Laribacter hongkongensis (strain HLHK9) TaxID=557598 RepID=C1D609_LARHH|nr:hypothetical protein LHK_01048 [Laribacter hongkongensis HLHK9]
MVYVETTRRDLVSPATLSERLTKPLGEHRQGVTRARRGNGFCQRLLIWITVFTCTSGKRASGAGHCPPIRSTVIIRSCTQSGSDWRTC